MAVLRDPKKEKFAQLIARGINVSKAYMQAGYKPNSGNAATMRKREDISLRIAEIQEQLRSNNEQELDDYLSDTGLNPTYIIRQVLETAHAAKEAGKFDAALNGFTKVGAELFGLFQQTKHIQVDSQHVGISHNSATISVQNVAGALAQLTKGIDSLQIEGTATPINSLPIPIIEEHQEYLERE